MDNIGRFLMIGGIVFFVVGGLVFLADPRSAFPLAACPATSASSVMAFRSIFHWGVPF
jgi:hypothetical protein